MVGNGLSTFIVRGKVFLDTNVKDLLMFFHGAVKEVSFFLFYIHFKLLGVCRAEIRGFQTRQARTVAAASRQENGYRPQYALYPLP